MEVRWRLLLVATLIIFNLLQFAHSKCLLNIPEVNPKRYLKLEEYNWERLPITLDVSRRITHQITSHVLKIFLEERLGYPDIVLRERNDPWDQPYAARVRLTPVFDEHDRLKNSPPETTLNTEVWISPEDDLLLWPDHNNAYVKTAGPIGPPARYGWFIPHILLLNNRNVPTYWRTFTVPDLVRQFTFSDAEMEFLKNYMKDNDSGYYCEEEFCSNGVHTPPQCENQTCAMLIASYAESEEFVVKHIEKMQLLVQVVWVGPHLAQVVQTLTERLASTTRSLVFLSLKPSEVVLPDDKTFASVVFPPCGDNDLDKDIGCRYDLHSLVKLYTSIFEKAARPAYEAYMKIQFDSSHYRDLLLRYRAALATSRNTTDAVATAACGWLNANHEEQYVWLGNDDEYSTLYIGGIFPMNPIRGVGAYYDVESIVLAAQLAQIAVNQNNSILRDYRLQLWVDDGRCEADYVLRSFIDHIKRNHYSKMVGILGPACSNTLESLAGVSHFYRTIVISYSAEGSSFSDRKKYPYFFRTIGENTQYQQVYLQLLAKLDWRRLAALTEDGQKYTEYLSLLQDLLTSKNYTFVMNRKFPTNRDQYAMKSYLEEMKSKSVRIIIGDVYDDAAREMMCQAYQLQMTAYHSYVWFLPSWLAPDWYDTDRYNQRLDSDHRVPCTTRQMIEAINGHLSLAHSSWAPDTAVMQTNETVGEWRTNINSLIKKRTNRTSISGYAGYAYDAVWMYALALDQLNKEDPSALSAIHAPNTTKRYVEILGKTDFNGVSGRIQFRGNPSRISVIQVIQWINNVSQIVGIFEPNISISNKDPMAGTLNLNESMIVWLNPDRTKPKDGTVRCFLGLAEYFGIEDCTLFLAIVNIFGFCILGGSLIIGFLVVKNRYDKKFKLTQEIMQSIGLDMMNVGALEKWEIPRDRVVINRKLGEGAFGFVYGGEAYFDAKGWVAVAVKTLKVGSTPEEKLEFLCEAEVMKRFEHANIVKLLGVCTKNEPTYTVMEFMLYGDLKTFLLARRHLVNEKLGEESDEISSKKLTTMALDVARALGYLAELKFVHRDVASRNCLVNAARVVKLGDFGMTRPMFDKDYYKFSRRGQNRVSELTKVKIPRNNREYTFLCVWNLKAPLLHFLHNVSTLYRLFYLYSK
ncbi:gamma-aminobutyric acid type B receptor subunit 1-like isoform X2 [Macrosteles quadrilineatus]|uniref:gamma-aminobutyric acid type B receptor subunit 1-like isoform X2 n=1 Tax=Macrosteles quadrilineatus TaxID=74068 RepID=UPI0023E1F935|nr:gamma-aminobutyric acid type B receptor subunit 1-like isoform X2 [Macrosteles quadrilineatus]